ncbi:MULTISPECIES: GH25 family lysozyme [Lactobacillus]|uniref:Lysozyme n=1 Tax=Lactobacillus xujianguonis TaxID=2495899 RepID=A0A437SWL9_9LACO|nr:MULTISPECIES: GH25 family lysozyme [Lactobacillus]RVU71325.1 lysozyme [Lactobacillus xujianguonis]RVU74028.1 lysozyme [Lactobacillus xujianguonis]
MKRFRHKLTLPMILTLLVLAIAGLFIGFFNFKHQTTQPSNSNSSALGIELNQDVDYVDLHKLQANGISFVYLRSTQGRSYFDENYLAYRDQVLGTKLAFGTEVYYSNESTANQQYNFFIKKVGLETGSLPVLITPAVNSRNASYLRSMGRFSQLLQWQGKKIVVAVSSRYRKFYPAGVQFMATGKRQPDKLKYAFWQYTTDGRVKDVSGLEKGVTMYTYNGTVAQYKQKYGQLTQ